MSARIVFLTLLVLGVAPAALGQATSSPGSSPATPAVSDVSPAPAAPLEGSPRRVDVKAFEWKIGTDPIVLGETEQVPITLRATLPDGTPLDVAPPQLRASTGTISAPAREGPGHWRAVFTPPAERFPHVAILSAQVDRAEDSVVGFVAVPLWGKGRLAVKTKPGSDVVIHLGNRTFGPSRANRRGRAQVDILAPPGPERAVARSKDPAGNASQKTVDLGVPPFNRIALVALDELAAADGSGEAQLLVFVVDKKGEPMVDATLAASADVGGFAGAPVALYPGVYRVRYRPGLVEVGTAKIEVSLQGSDASKASAEVRLIPGRPVRAELTPSRAVLTADDDHPVEVTARFFDQAGNPVPSQGARLDVSYGRIDRVERLAGGQRVLWVLPRKLPATTPTLTARATTGEVLGSVSVALEAGRPAVLSMDPIEAVAADGQSAANVVVRASDRAGNPVLPRDVTLAFPAGSVAGLSPTDDVMTALLVPDVRDQETLSKVTARLGPLTAERPVRVLPRPRAQLLVGVGLQGAWNYDDLYATGPEASFLLRLPGLDGALHAGLSLGALVALPGETAADGLVLERRHIAYPLHLELGWRPLLTTSLALHVGAAAGLTLADSERKAPGARVAQRTITPAASAQAVVGIAWRLGSGYLEADLRAGFAAPLDDASTSAPLGAGLVVGYRFGL